MKKMGTFIIALLLIMILGCPDFPRLGPASVERAWNYYEDGEYDEAIVEFDDVIDAEPDNAEAYNGLGWCYAIKSELSTSVAYFDTALQKQSSLVDPYAGLAFAYADIPDDQSAVDAAGELMQRDSLYFFGHDNDITWHDVVLIKARALCNLGNFSAALTEVQVLNGNFTCNVTTPDGRKALLQEIERLRGIY
jgi:tetratricopeptide (TPR) repeat protein